MLRVHGPAIEGLPRSGRWIRRGSGVIVLDLGAGSARMGGEELLLGDAFELWGEDLETGRPTLRRGSRGEVVRVLQSLLHRTGFDPGPVDGIFGSRTQSAVLAFQRARRLLVDGIVGPQTWGALEAVAPREPATPAVPVDGRRPTPFAKRLAGTAQQQHSTYHLQDERDSALSRQIQKYWEDLGFSFPGTGTPWSAVFVSWCVKTAGATSGEFTFSAQHSQFVHSAIQNAAREAGVFRGRKVTAYPPSIGDIIQNNREGNKYSYEYAASHKGYSSHSAIVVEKGVDNQGTYVLTVGGNESDSIRSKVVRLYSNGLIVQRATDPYICVIQCLK